MQLVDKVALVTGAGGAIGQAISLGLAREGAKVAVSDVDLTAAQRTVSLVGPNSIAIQADVSKPEDVSRMMEETVRRFGRLDILVNNAGICPRKPVMEMELDEWERVIAVNLRSMFLCCKAAGLIMKEQGGGKIVNVTSGRGQSGMNGAAHYAASKGGVTALTRTLGMEWSPLKINVNAVGPGMTLSPMTKAIFTPEQLKERAAQTPEKRLGEPEDVVGAVVYLASDASKAMYGQIIYMKTP